MKKGGQVDQLMVHKPTGFASPPQINKPQSNSMLPSQLLDNRTKKRVEPN